MSKQKYSRMFFSTETMIGIVLATFFYVFVLFSAYLAEITAVIFALMIPRLFVLFPLFSMLDSTTLNFGSAIIDQIFCIFSNFRGSEIRKISIL